MKLVAIKIFTITLGFVFQVALNKQAVSQMENDMERWLKERERLSHRLEKLAQKKRRLLLG
jgi:hypothetical protein